MFLQIATVEVPEEHMGSVVELLGRRRGQMFNMENVGYVNASILFITFSSLVNFLFLSIAHILHISLIATSF